MSLIPKKGTVYVVDDDEAVRDSLQWLLEGKDYRVKCFDSAESFLSRFDPREVACLIADIRMDGMSGLELQDRLLERRSPLPVTFITGHGDVPMAVTTMKKGAMDFIEKPFKEEELLALVERMLDQARAATSARICCDSATPSINRAAKAPPLRLSDWNPLQEGGRGSETNSAIALGAQQRAKRVAVPPARSSAGPRRCSR
jgi:DNA-binding NtrC family response regulator